MRDLLKGLHDTTVHQPIVQGIAPVPEEVLQPLPEALQQGKPDLACWLALVCLAAASRSLLHESITLDSQQQRITQESLRTSCVKGQPDRQIAALTPAAQDEDLSAGHERWDEGGCTAGVLQIVHAYGDMPTIICVVLRVLN